MSTPPDTAAREHLIRCWQLASVARPPGYTVAAWMAVLAADPVDRIISDHAATPHKLPPAWSVPPPEVASFVRRFLLDASVQWLQERLDEFTADDRNKPPQEIRTWFAAQVALFGRHLPVHWVSFEDRFIVLVTRY